MVHRHKMLRVRQGLEAKLRVKPMGVPRHQYHPPQPLQVRVLNDRFHEPLRYAPASMPGHDKDIRDISDDGKIGNHLAKPTCFPARYTPKQSECWMDCSTTARGMPRAQ